MGNVINLLLRYGVHVLFIVLQITCFHLIVNYNNGQREIFINSTNLLTRSLNSRVDRIENYLKLGEVNDSLQTQNAALLKQLINANVNLQLSAIDSITADSAQYQVIPVEICNATFFLKNNSLTLCAGSNDGIEKDMGIISKQGIVGIVKKTSPNRSLVLSLLNTQTNISCAIKRNHAHGSLVWSGEEPNVMDLTEIPKHLSIEVGDTVITSGYSTIFPRGIEVGKVENFSLADGSNTYRIKVRLFNDPSTVDIVYAIKNNLAEEQKNLEQQQ